MLCNSRLIINSNQFSAGSNPSEVLEFLTELGLHEEAIQLGLAFNLKGVALSFYEVMTNSESSFGGHKELLENNIDKLSAQTCLALCKHLIVGDVVLPQCLQDKIQASYQVSSCINAYLCPSENSQTKDFMGLLSFLGTGKQLLDRITQCAQQDIHVTLALIDALKYHKDTMQELARQHQAKLRMHESQLREAVKISNKDHFLQTIVRDNVNAFELQM